MKLTIKKNTLLKGLMAGMLMIQASACNDFLKIEPKDRLTGNNFYQSKDDVEANMANMYSKFFDKINESWVIGAIGEARSGEIFVSPNVAAGRAVVEVLGRNDLLTAISGGQAWSDQYHLERITNWAGYYQVIQTANILLDKLNEGIPGLSETDKKRYIAETTFIRCFTYFWMVRLYGDVVYYTDAYHSEPLAREDMVSVINKCIADLEPQKDNIAWVLGDPALKGARASRGSIVALLMHMNMWNAGFDSRNAQGYYQKVAALGEEIVNSGQYRLLPLTDDGWAEVTKGRSDESLFEFYRSINYDDGNSGLALFADHFLRWPYKFPRYDNQVSFCYYISDYMEYIYPENIADKRKTVWFEDMLADNGQFALRKFGLNVYASGNEDVNPDNTFMIFRYADAILLWAEALANLGGSQTAAAIAAVNMVRSRAEATPYSGAGGTELLDFIFAERERELFGEGLRWFDLVRTRRIMSSRWARHTLNSDEYNRRAWTWPIDQSARINNPLMTLNEYWLSVR